MAVALGLLTLATLLRDVPCDGCLLEIPEKIASPAPIVVALHGDEGSPAKIAALWAPIAREKGFILLAPRCPKSEGCDGSWWRWNASTAWLDDQVRAVNDKHPTDEKRRWLTAWSGGASYASLHMPELAKTFAALSLAGGGIATEATTCLEGAGGACAPVHLLAGELNPHHAMTERTRRALEGCGHQVTWALQKATDHAGEWRAYVREARSIADWLAGHEMGCTEGSAAAAAASASAWGSASGSASPSASASVSGPEHQPPSARGCACSVVASRQDAATWWAGLALGGLLVRHRRRRSALRCRTMHRRSIALAGSAILLLHCSGDAAAPKTAASGVAATSAAQGPTSAPRPDEGGMPEPVSIPAIEAACKTARCSGPGSRVQVIRKGTRITAYFHHGDLSSCSHPPSIYFDREGKELGAIAMRPIAPGSDEAKRVEDEHERLGGGGKPAEEVDCTGRVRPK